MFLKLQSGQTLASSKSNLNFKCFQLNFADIFHCCLLHCCQLLPFPLKPEKITEHILALKFPTNFLCQRT